MRTIAQKWLDWGTLGPSIEQYRALIDEDMREDTKKLDILRTVCAVAMSHRVAKDAGHSARRPASRLLCERRREYLLNHAEINKPCPRLPRSRIDRRRDGAQQLTPDDNVIVEAKVVGELKPQTVLLYYASKPGAPFEQVEMLDDGQHDDQQPGDGTYSAVMAGVTGTCEVRYYVEARADESLGTTAFMPAEAEMGAYRYQVVAKSESESAVVINEVHGDQQADRPGPAGRVRRLARNLQSQRTRVSTCRECTSAIRDAELLKWSFPPGTTLPAHGTLVVWLDEDVRGRARAAREFQAIQEGRDRLPERLGLARQRDSATSSSSVR